MIRFSKAVLIMAGLLLFFLGAGLGVVGGRKVLALETPLNEITLRAKHTDQCKKAAEQAGYEVDHQGVRVIVSTNDLENYQAKIFQAGWLTQGCEGFVMEQFCMGLSCENEQLRAALILTLEYSDKSLRM